MKNLTTIQNKITKIKKLIIDVLRNFFDKSYVRKDSDFEVYKKDPWIINLLQVLLGVVYSKYKKQEENMRIWFFNSFEKLSNIRILYEVLYHSRSLIVVLILLLTLPLLFYQSYLPSFTLNKESINVLLTAYVGGATAVLGIIFALYSVGFQMTTQRFSSNVTDYLNREKVGKFFFKLLSLSAVFSLFNLLIQLGLEQTIMTLFIISTFLIVTSLLGIIVFKDDYMTKLKPRQVFERLYDQNLEAIKYVNSYDNPTIKSFRLTRQKNIKSFKVYLPIRQSWSLIMALQKQVNERLDIQESLYNDLIREGRIEDASFSIISLGYFLAEYSSVRHFIDKKYGWWFPEYQDLVTSESAEMLPIKANYEAMGIGKLGTTKKDYEWLEKKILAFFEKIRTQTDFVKYPLIGNILIFAYEVLLAGQFTKTDKGLEKLLRGAYENQDFSLFDRGFSSFLLLGQTIAKIADCQANFLNSFGQIKTVTVDGFSLRSFPGRLNDWQPNIKNRLKKIYNKKRILVTKEEIISWKLPMHFYAFFENLYEQIEVEKIVERSIITEFKWLEEDVLERLRKKEREVLGKYEKEVIQAVVTLSKGEGNQFYKNYLGNVILGMFNQLISQERLLDLESVIKTSTKDLLVLFFSVEKNKFLEQEYRDPIDFGIFEAVVARNKIVYSFYIKLFIISQLHLAYDKDSVDYEKILKIIRRPLMLGGLTYLISELDQDFYFVNQFTMQIENLYPQIKISELYGLSLEVGRNFGYDVSFRVTYEEANRYRYYYRQVINSIQKLPKDYITSGGPPYGFSSRETVKHQSKFIRRMAEFRFSDMDECSKGYVEWLKIRNQIKRLINVIKSKKII